MQTKSVKKYDKAVKYVESGMTIAEASKKAGLHPSQFYNFRKKLKPLTASRKTKSGTIFQIRGEDQLVAATKIKVYIVEGVSKDVAEYIRSMS